MVLENIVKLAGIFGRRDGEGLFRLCILAAAKFREAKGHLVPGQPWRAFFDFDPQPRKLERFRQQECVGGRPQAAEFGRTYVASPASCVPAAI